MEGALLHSSADHESMSMSSYKKTRNPRRNANNQTRPFVPSRTNSIGNLYYSESLPKMEMMVNGGVFFNPSLARLSSSPYPLHHHQPPLLPLPTESRKFQSLPSYKKQNKGIKNQANTKVSKQGAKYVSNKSNPEKICGLVFPEAPPPSSLPMPKFSLKPKMSCRIEANNSSGSGRVDVGAGAGNLCTLLNLW